MFRLLLYFTYSFLYLATHNSKSLPTPILRLCIVELKEYYTIIIVTHNMQQAARTSDLTAFFYLGELVEMDKTKTIFTNPSKKQTEDYISGRFG